MCVMIELKIDSSHFGVEQYLVKQISDDAGHSAFEVWHNDEGSTYKLTNQETGPLEWVIGGEVAQSFLAKLREVSVTVCPDFAMGLDGKTVTLSIENGFNRVEFRWWLTMPEQWVELQGLLDCLYDCRPWVKTRPRGTND